MLVTAFNATQPIAIGLTGFLLGALGVQHITHRKVSWVIIILAIVSIACGTVVITL
jgi:hypothetical protein